MLAAFEDKCVDRVHVKDKTYMLLPRAVGGSACLIGHHGGKYVVIATSLTMFLVLVLSSDKKAGRRDTESVDNAVVFAKNLVSRLALNGY